MKQILLPISSAFALAFFVACGAKITPVQSPTDTQQTLNNAAPVTEGTAVAAANAATTSDPNVMLSEVQYQGKELYESHCNKCHALEKPAKFTKQQWDPILVRMQKQARLGDDDMAKITAYLFAMTD